MKARVGFGLVTALCFLLGPIGAGGQTPPAGPAFEVATVKPSPPPDMAKLAEMVRAGKMPKFGPQITPAQAEYIYMSLKDLIANAYSLKGYQVDGPAWLGTERFDIVGKIPDGASKDDAPKMLQALLLERFKLAAHLDNQERPVLALVVAKGGPKLKESPPAPPPVDEDAPLKPGERKIDTPNGPMRITRNADGSTTINMGAKGTITQRLDPQSQTITLESTNVTMAGFAEMLTNLLQMGGGSGRQVVDETGLKGSYQVAVDISLADIMAIARSQGMGVAMPLAAPGAGSADSSPAAQASDPAGGGSSVFGSVQKLGLKLEPRKEKVDQLVIDHVEKTPTEN